MASAAGLHMEMRVSQAAWNPETEPRAPGGTPAATPRERVTRTLLQRHPWSGRHPGLDPGSMRRCQERRCV